MKRIVVLDTWINDTNLGNRIIMDAVSSELRRLFPHDFIFHAPAQEFIRAGRSLVQSSDHIVLAGTNLLSSRMNRVRFWGVSLADTRWLGPVVMMGVGWWQYESRSPNLYTRLLLKGILHRHAKHSLRDVYTADRLRRLGFAVLNTGCPTMWRLGGEHSARIPTTKADDVVVTFTEYNQQVASDEALMRVVQRNYRRVYVWPQQFGDYAYAKRIGGGAIEILDPSVEALDQCLALPSIDYVGTRLHAGIRALQMGRRTLIVTVDNRAAEMGRDFNLPVFPREQLDTALQNRVRASWPTDVRPDAAAIDEWCRQFGETAI